MWWLLTLVVGSFLVPYIVQVIAARNKLTALIVEIRYNRVVLNRFKKSGAGIQVVSRSAYEDFRKDYLLAKTLAKDKKHRAFDHIHNAYAYHSSRLVGNADGEWHDVFDRFSTADQKLMDYLKLERPRLGGIVPLFDKAFFSDIDVSLRSVSE